MATVGASTGRVKCLPSRRCFLKFAEDSDNDSPRLRSCVAVRVTSVCTDGLTAALAVTATRDVTTSAGEQWE